MSTRDAKGLNKYNFTRTIRHEFVGGGGGGGDGGTLICSYIRRLGSFFFFFFFGEGGGGVQSFEFHYFWGFSEK